MFISKEKFGTFHAIRGNYSLYVKDRRDLRNDKIIKIAQEKYNVILTEEEIKKMIKDYERFMFKYIN